jgi:pyruvate kinase
MGQSAEGSGKRVRTNAELATLVARVAAAIAADATICVTESGALARHLADLHPPRLIAATTNHETFQALQTADLEILRLPLHAADKYSQVRHALSVALKAGRVSLDELVATSTRERETWSSWPTWTLVWNVSPSPTCSNSPMAFGPKLWKLRS